MAKREKKIAKKFKKMAKKFAYFAKKTYLCSRIDLPFGRDGDAIRTRW